MVLIILAHFVRVGLPSSQMRHPSWVNDADTSTKDTNYDKKGRIPNWLSKQNSTDSFFWDQMKDSEDPNHKERAATSKDTNRIPDWLTKSIEDRSDQYNSGT